MKAYGYVEAMIFTFIFFFVSWLQSAFYATCQKRQARVATPRDFAKLDTSEATVYA